MIGLERRNATVFVLRSTADFEARELARVLEQASALHDAIGRLPGTNPKRVDYIQRSVDHVIAGLTREIPIKNEEG